VVGREIEARPSESGAVGNAFDDAEVEEVKKFVAIGTPVGGFTNFADVLSLKY
jgi:hypothetical protein